MEVIPKIEYHIENNPEPEEISTVIIYTNFTTSVDMDPIPTHTRFSLSAKEFIEDEVSPRKDEFYRFLTESKVDEVDAVTILKILIRLAVEVTSSVEDFSHCALTIFLTLDIVPLRESDRESDINDPQFEEAIRASLDDSERNIGFRPASKLGVGSLSRRRYKKKRKTSLIADSKRKTYSVADRCTICLEEFKTGRKIATLTCGHEFDNRCIMKWFKVSHVCPLCRFELHCGDDGCAS